MPRHPPAAPIDDAEIDALDEAALRHENERWRPKSQKRDEGRAWAVAVAALPAERISPTVKLVAFTLWPEMESRQEHGATEPKPI